MKNFDFMQKKSVKKDRGSYYKTRAYRNTTNVDIGSKRFRKERNFDNLCTFFLNKVIKKIVVFKDKTCEIELAFNVMTNQIIAINLLKRL